MLVFGQFSVEKFETQKGEGTKFLVRINSLENMGDINKRLDGESLWDVQGEGQISDITGYSVTDLDVILVTQQLDDKIFELGRSLQF